MSRENAARRNHAARKLRKSEHLTLEIKEAVQVILDLLNPTSGYRVAWPSAATIGKRMGRSRRSGMHYVKIIKALGIFHWKCLTPEAAANYCEQHFGIRLKLDRCGGQAPNLFIVNEDHPLWSPQRDLPADVDREMGEIARRIKAARNAKTTSCLASDPACYPKDVRYSLKRMRRALSRTRKRLSGDVANEEVLRLEEAERWCREELLSSVANDMIDGVANDTQVFKRSSCEADEIVTSQEECHQKAEADLSVIPSSKRVAVRQPCSQALRADTPPAHRFRDRDAESRRLGLDSTVESIALAGSECRSASASLVGSGFAARIKSRSTVPVRHKVSEQGVGRLDEDLFATMIRLEDERRESEERLRAAYADRPDADILDVVSLAVRCPSFATGQTQGRP